MEEWWICVLQATWHQHALLFENRSALFWSDELSDSRNVLEDEHNLKTCCISQRTILEQISCVSEGCKHFFFTLIQITVYMYFWLDKQWHIGNFISSKIIFITWQISTSSVCSSTIQHTLCHSDIPKTCQYPIIRISWCSGRDYTSSVFLLQALAFKLRHQNFSNFKSANMYVCWSCCRSTD